MSVAEWLTILSAGIVPAVLVSLGLHWWRPGWARIRKTLIGAAIVPGVIVALCGMVFVNAATILLRTAESMPVAWQ